MAKLWVIIGALNGFLAVALGAIGAHAIKGGEDALATFKSWRCTLLRLTLLG